MEEGRVDGTPAGNLVKLGKMVGNLRRHALEEGVSTRLPVVYAARLICGGVAPALACEAAVTRAIIDVVEIQEAISEIVSGIFQDMQP